ncbi:MAG: T9SS type A sorting domain-containing protein [Ignavibacteriales bacterium]|nr:MAG: T9SS type A sorting domain-containing protein [Ignavibacteriales bacterium]
MGVYGGPGRTSLPKVVSDVVGSLESPLPKSFLLNQNYPNPFNPTTKIKFSISDVETGHAPSQRMVTLAVYDALGSKVTTLMNEEKPAGTYEVTFNGEGLASGVYYYKLTAAPGGGHAGNFSETKKMILLK